MNDAPLRLGLMSPLTGIAEIYGAEISRAAQIACAEVNAAGGVLGRRLELVIEDDGSFPETAVRAANRLVSGGGCHAIIGNLLSNSRLAVSNQVSEPCRVPQLNFSFYEGGIKSPYFFHFAALPNQQIDLMIPFMAERHGRKMFFAGNNYEWPRGSIDACKRVLEARDGKVLGEEYLAIRPNEGEIFGLLERVARSGADVFVPYFAGLDQISVLKRFCEIGLKGHMAVVMGHFDERIAGFLEPEQRDGFYSSNTFFMSVDTPAARACLGEIAKRPEVSGLWPEGNGVLTNFGEGAYICVKAFAHAAEAAGGLDPDALVAALETVRIEAPQGLVVMDERTHHATVNSYLARCTAEGRFDLVESFGPVLPHIPRRYCEAEPTRSAAGTGPDTHAKPLRPAIADCKPADLDLRTTSDLLQFVGIAMLACTETGQVIDANSVCEAIFGYEPGEFSGMSVNALVPPHLRELHDGHIRKFVASPETERRMTTGREILGYRKDGTFFPLDASIAKFRGASGAWILVITMRDISEHKQTEAELTHRATHDALTGLPNRALIQDRLGAAIEHSRRQGDGLAAIFIDLDGFKDINDTHGHSTGDRLLEEASQRLLRTVRPGDTVGRLAGDEFIVVCENVEDPAQMSSLSERLLSILKAPYEIGKLKLFVTASIGISIGHGATHSAEDILRSADTAMYSVKGRGRDGWAFFNQGLQEEAQQRAGISNGLRTAIQNDEFRVLFQPIVNAETGVIEGAEVLLRWHPREGALPPALFIPIAERTGSIIAIGRWVFEQACRAEHEWSQRFASRAPYVTVNVSARQLSEPSIVEEFAEIIARTGAAPERLVLEVTETSLMAEVQANLEVLAALADLGMQIAVDDFGTGYSSFAQLMRLNADTLKIDKVFIQGLDRDPESRVIVRALCRIAKSLNLKLVAEGVETQDQRNKVRLYGCDYIQGYFFHRPLDRPDFVNALKHSIQTHEHGEDGIVFLVYISRTEAAVGHDDMTTILAASNQNNLVNGVTGYLFYMDRVFVQYLEGDEATIWNLYEKIRADARHTDVEVIAQGPLNHRLFTGWSMGFRSLDQPYLVAQAELADPQGASYEWLKDNPAFCCSLFEAISLGAL